MTGETGCLDKGGSASSVATCTVLISKILATRPGLPARRSTGRAFDPASQFAANWLVGTS
jgi:hypothetical protein